MQTFLRRSLLLTAEQWATLERLAAEFDATAPTGQRAGSPAWRSLIKEIANGTLVLSRKETSK